MTRVDMHRRLFISLLALVSAILGGAVAGPVAAQAQGSDVDLAVSIEVPDSISGQDAAGPTIAVTNRGSDTAYTVEVVIEADNISLDPTSTSPPGKITVPPIGSVALQPEHSKLIWSIVQLPGRSIYHYTVSTGHTTGIKVVRYVATVSSRVALEPESLRHDNRAEVWQIRNITDNQLQPAVPGYAVTVAVDKRFPAEQGDVIFTVVASHTSNTDINAGRAHLRDVQVTIPVPGGLIYKSHTAPAGTSYDSDTEIWTIGDWHPTSSAPSQTRSLTLTATRAADTVLNEQCVTAEISAKPPEPLARTADNRRMVCLGEKSVLFREGQTDLLTLYSCTGVTTYPCSTAGDHLELVVEGGTASSKVGLPENLVLQSNKVTVHVPDYQDRRSSSSSRAWYTGSVSTHATNPTRVGPGIVANLALPSPTYSAYEFAITDTTSGGKPGTLKMLNATNTNFAILDIDNTPSRGPINTTSTSIPLIFEFGELGTYVAQLTASATHQETSTKYSDTGTYTFHVGPIAELAVRDAGPSPDATPSQRAFTIRALNNGPDSAPAAQMTVDLQGATVSQAIASQGSYSNGVWTIGNLSVNAPAIAPTLTLITDAPADTPITATITNTQDYEVCISSTGTDLSHTTQAACEAVTGASWHTAKYYDYKSANNTATVTAQAGTGGPQAAITVEWTAPADVTVSRYQIWRQGSPWKLIAEVPTGQTSYTDTTAEPGRAYLYTVRALDAQGIPVSSETLVAAPQAGSGQGSGGGSGGSTRPPPTDHHGNSPATATPLAPTARVGGFLHADDQDYFRLVLPHAGLLYVETTGWSNTVGTVWQGGVELGSAELGGRLYNFKLGVPVQPGPVVIRVTERSPTAFGTYRLYTRFIAGSVDQPPPLTVQNGLGMVTGWLCSAGPVVLEIDGLPYHPAPMPASVPPPPPRVVGTGGSGLPPRAVDPHELCDDTATGFGLPVNWNLLGDGEHTITAYLDGLEFARTVVEVTTLGEEFVHDAHGTCTVDDFPLPDHSVNLVWQEAGQHFALSDGQPPPPVGATHASDVLGRLETPAPGSFQSGRGSISGWVCDAEAVSIEIDGTPYPVAYGTARADTAAVCENPAPGFGLSLDWNRLGPGDHEVVALADGVAFGRATVRVTTLGAAFVRDAGSAFVRGLAGECVAEDFPAPGEAVHLEWQEATQNFVITTVE